MGKIKTSGNAVMEFEPDSCEFRVVVNVSSGTSGDTLSKGKYRTEDVLRELGEKAGIDTEGIILVSENMNAAYDRREGFFYRKEFLFRYQADNRITETVTSLLQNMEDVEYSYTFELSGRAAGEEKVLSAAVEDARAKADRIAASLGTKIAGCEEIRYEYFGDGEDKDSPVMLKDARAGAFAEDLLASKLKTPKISISKTVNAVWLTE